jgi:hypothetical protein
VGAAGGGATEVGGAAGVGGGGSDGALTGAGARSDGGPDGGFDGTDPKAPPADPARSPLLLGLDLVTAARCGPELTSPEGLEAQTCVLTQGEETWARTYYRNASGRALEAVLSFMGPAGHTVQLRCAVGAEDEPQSCETPHEPTRGEPAAYTAIAEFSQPDKAAAASPLLLRSGSNARADDDH